MTTIYLISPFERDFQYGVKYTRPDGGHVDLPISVKANTLTPVELPDGATNIIVTDGNHTTVSIQAGGAAMWRKGDPWMVGYAPAKPVNG